jgi:FkbM family methyltransferase
VAAGIPELYRILRERRQAGRPLDFEALLRRFYLGFLKPGDIAIDVGAFKGTHTIPIANAIRGEGAQLHALEANPAMAGPLRAQLATPAFDFVTLHDCAAGAEDGEAGFVLALDSPGYSGLQQRDYDQPNMRTERITVRVARLDTLLGPLPRLDYIKLDIEGGEFDALRGAAGLVARHRPAISFEFGHRSYDAYGVDPGEVFDWFEARGYLLFDIIGTPLPRKERFLRADSTPGLWDFLAVPAEAPKLRQLARAQREAMEA